MKKLLLSMVLFVTCLSVSFSQNNTGTLKVFSEIPGITVFVDESPQSNYQDIQKIPAGTHYVRVMNGEKKIYSQVITINTDQVTTVLIEQSENVQKTEDSAVSKPDKPVGEKPKEISASGTLNIFCEIQGTTVYLNDIKQGEDIRTINSVPAGNHYLKVLKDGVNLFGELVTVNPGQTTTVLIKNDGQVAEKVLESKTKEREEYNASKIDVLFASKSITTTKGASTLFPGYYGYWGYSNSISSTSEIPDFKIIKGGVQEISDLALANLAENKSILEQNARDNLRQRRMVNVGAPMLLAGTLVSLVYLADFMLDKPFLHKNNPTHPGYEAYAATAGIVSGVIGYAILSGSEKTVPNHYYRVQDAAKDAQDYNSRLKEKLGLPASYDVR